MVRQPRVLAQLLAATALGLIASAPVSVFARNLGGSVSLPSAPITTAEQPFVLAQAQGKDGKSELEQLKKRQKKQKRAPAETPAPAQQPAPQPAARAPEPKPTPAEAPAAAPRQKARKEQAARPVPVESRPPRPGRRLARNRLQGRSQPKRQPLRPGRRLARNRLQGQSRSKSRPPRPGRRLARNRLQSRSKSRPPRNSLQSVCPNPKQLGPGSCLRRAPVRAAEQPATARKQRSLPDAEPVRPKEQPRQVGETLAPKGQAPVLDSQKQPAATEGRQPARQPAEPQTRQAKSREPVAPPPADDRGAQQRVRSAKIQSVTAEEGRRIELKPEAVVRERPQGVEVVREVGDRTIIQINNQIIVESNNGPRIARNAREVYYEELSRGMIREVIVREDGSRVVTIRDRYGDVIRRSRFTPDNREYVLVYVDEDNYDRVGEWRDPGLDLPPMLLTIPVEEYILDAERVEGPDAYYTFLEQPPVEHVERLYSVDEVRRSARIRDKVRRIDLDTINFAFGSAEIDESEIGKLEGVAQAMERLLKENPAESFLIEGHTDAVGSDVANLALSDRRAGAVAEALTNVFAIPPENLVPQGYGEQYLKVSTEERDRENRRVAIRRITPLVAPVASAD